jgi:hypothetical protein
MPNCTRCWKFGPMIARRLRRYRPRPNNCCHPDEMVVRIAGKKMYLWRAVDHEGGILDMLVQRRRDKRTTMVLTPSRSGGRGMPQNVINYDGPIDTHRLLILGQCSGPGGIVSLSRLIACVMHRQTAAPVSSPVDASSSARPELSVCALSRVA